MKHTARSWSTALLSTSLSLALGACAGDAPPDATDEPPEVVAARAHLAAAAPEIAPADLEVIRDKTDELGTTHVRHQQMLDGIPVIGGEAIVHLDRDGALTSITDKLVRGLHVDTHASITADDAIARALDATVGAGRETAKPAADLRVLRDKDGDHLVWQVAIESLPAGDADAWTKPIVLVDAHTGDVLHHWDRVEDTNVNATGDAVYDGNVGIKTWQDSAGKYWLEDDVRKLGVFSLQNGQPGDSIARYANNSTSWLGFTTAVQAQWSLERAWDYYFDVFNRSNIDGNGGPGYATSIAGGTIVSGLTHWGSSANNAKWIDPEMIFGDGDGTEFSPLVSLDIVAHEFTHGVTSREAGLGGLNEAPALNEHISDVFGAAAEAFHDGGASANTWMIGEDAYTPGVAGDALRYMNDPAKDGASLDYWRSDLDAYDAHYGCGVGNLAFYLTVNGGTHPRRSSVRVTGVGLDKAQRVWYRALTTYLTSDSNYADLRKSTLLAASDLYGAGSPTYRALDTAWEVVGIPDVQTPGFPSEVRSSLGTGQAVVVPSASGFSSSGSVLGFLGYQQANLFTLELWRRDPSTGGWSKVASSGTSGSNNQVVSYAGTSGQYRWVVRATSGSGAYSLGWKS